MIYTPTGTNARNNPNITPPQHKHEHETIHQKIFHPNTHKEEGNKQCRQLMPRI